MWPIGLFLKSTNVIRSQTFCVENIQGSSIDLHLYADLWIDLIPPRYSAGGFPKQTNKHDTPNIDKFEDWKTLNFFFFTVKCVNNMRSGFQTT